MITNAIIGLLGRFILVVGYLPALVLWATAGYNRDLWPTFRAFNEDWVAHFKEVWP